MVAVQHPIGVPDTSFSNLISNGIHGGDHLSVFNYNILLPNSVDGWWTYKMYLPPLTESNKHISSWDFRRNLIRDRISAVDADIICFQEVSPVSFESDFSFMLELGYDGKELFKKGRFRPATFYKTSRWELVTPAVHKDRTLLTVFRRKIFIDETVPMGRTADRKNWYVLNCHLQAGKQASRRLRQINEGVRAAVTTARKLKERDPETNIRLVVCGDFNGGDECGAIHYLEKGYIDESFYEDGDPITSNRKTLPLSTGMIDAMKCTPDRVPTATLVVPELISTLVQGEAYENPKLSDKVIQKLTNIFHRLARGTTSSENNSEPAVMTVADVKRFLVVINGEVGRGSEFREAARQMGFVEGDSKATGKSPDNDENREDDRVVFSLPVQGVLTLEGFLKIYQDELTHGKFWGIAHDLAVLGEPLPNVGVFQARYDRIYHSSSIKPISVISYESDTPCPNEKEPSDHLPVTAAFCDA